jgi:homoserine O-acetyltransferase
MRKDPTVPYSFKADYLIEGYLDYQGDKFCNNYDPNSLLYISKAMDMFDMSHPIPGSDFETKFAENTHYDAASESLILGLKDVQMPTLIIGAQSDMLFPIWQQREIADSLTQAGNDRVTMYELNANFGHDTFLLDVINIGNAVKAHLEFDSN